VCRAFGAFSRPSLPTLAVPLGYRAAWSQKQPAAFDRAPAPTPSGPHQPHTRPAALRPLAPHVGNHHHPHNVCLYGSALAPAVLSASGFHWVNEGDANKTKWGYVALKPGAELRLQIDTTTPYNGPNSTVAVYLAHLKSYEHMGIATARCAQEETEGRCRGKGWGSSRRRPALRPRPSRRVCPETRPRPLPARRLPRIHPHTRRRPPPAGRSCAAGCTCQSVGVNAHHRVRESTTFFARLDATRHPNCTLSVLVSGVSDSGEHKFKVGG
jgi:hypothetical protein